MRDKPPLQWTETTNSLHFSNSASSTHKSYAVQLSVPPWLIVGHYRLELLLVFYKYELLIHKLYSKQRVYMNFTVGLERSRTLLLSNRQHDKQHPKESRRFQNSMARNQILLKCANLAIRWTYFLIDTHKILNKLAHTNQSTCNKIDAGCRKTNEVHLVARIARVIQNCVH